MIKKYSKKIGPYNIIQSKILSKYGLRFYLVIFLTFVHLTRYYSSFSFPFRFLPTKVSSICLCVSCIISFSPRFCELDQAVLLSSPASSFCILIHIFSSQARALICCIPSSLWLASLQFPLFYFLLQYLVVVNFCSDFCFDAQF